jgi:hypothetical protein
MKAKIKTGDVVVINEIKYTFLGYKDYAQKWGVFADSHGNKHERYMFNL